LVDEYVRSGDNKTGDTTIATAPKVSISSSIVNRAFENGEAVITQDAADDDRFDAGASIISQNISSAMCVPLIHQNDRLGVIYVDTRGTTSAFVEGDLELLVAVSGAAATAIKNARFVQMLEKAYEDTLRVLATTIEMRDHYTVGHTVRVTNFTLEIARELGWSEEKLEEVRRGGVMHDIGKIAVEDAILRKPDRLTEEEFAQIKIHPEKGAQLLQELELLHPLIPYALYHHERFDGRGYPYGLKGEDIPIEGRALAVADTFDAMTSNRPYRKGLNPEIAIEEIENNKGSQFDPACADAMIRAYKAGKIDRILQDYNKEAEKSIACPFCSTYVALDATSQKDDEIECNVCHRMVRLIEENNAYYGELIPQSGGQRIDSSSSTE
jgi:putative nucleotidyltransferase with HDIG domain